MAGKSKRSKGMQKRLEETTQCFYCTCLLTIHDHEHSPTHKTIDHFIPRDKGGRGLSENLVVCCYACNQLKGNLLPDEFVDKIEGLIRWRSFQRYSKWQFYNMIAQIEQLKIRSSYYKATARTITNR